MGVFICNCFILFCIDFLKGDIWLLESENNSKAIQFWEMNKGKVTVHLCAGEKGTARREGVTNYGDVSRGPSKHTDLGFTLGQTANFTDMRIKITEATCAWRFFSDSRVCHGPKHLEAP